MDSDDQTHSSEHVLPARDVCATSTRFECARRHASDGLHEVRMELLRMRVDCGAKFKNLSYSRYP